MSDDERERSQATLAQLLKRAKEEWPMQVEMEKLVARQTRIKFLALVAEGFTETQALDLCKSWRA